MKLKGSDELVAAYARVMCLSEIGEHALGQFPEVDLLIVETTDATLFDAKKVWIQINMTKMATKSPEEQCATLCHETFHFFHATYNFAQFRDRQGLPRVGFTVWGNYEEQLTISGSCPSVGNDADGWKHSLFNENAVLRGFRLPVRTSHDASSEARLDAGQPGAQVGVISYVTPAKSTVPPRIRARFQKK